MGNDRRNLLALGLLLTAAVTAGLLALAAWKSIENYQPPPPLQARLPGGQALSRRVVLIVLDGIRADIVPRMDFLRTLAGRGSSGITSAVRPSLSLPARASMVTGARPAIHGVTTNGRIFKTVGESVFSLAKQAGLPIAAAGWRYWSDSLGDALEKNVFIYRDRPSDDAPLSELFSWQQDKCRQAVEFLGRWDRGMMVVSAVTPDIVGHRYGGKSPEYVQTARDADGCVQRIVQTLDDGDTTFVVASDHGHIDRLGRGGHGGAEPEVVEVPTILYGRAVKRGSGWRGEQIDIAPTICALLGLPLPASNQGRILWDAIDVPPQAQDDLRQREAQQHAFARAHLPDEPAGRIQERWNRLPGASVAFALCAGAFILAAFRLREIGTPAVIGAITYYVAYLLLFWAGGLDYSLSSVGREGASWFFVARNLAAASIALTASAYLVKWTSRLPVRDFLLDLAILIGATIAVQVAVIHFLDGLFMIRFVPNLDRVFKAYLDLTQLSAIGVAAAFLFVTAGVEARLALGISRQRVEGQSPDAAGLFTDGTRIVAE